jgi:hypothetical protein
VKRATTGLLAEVSLQQGGVLSPHLWAEPTTAATTGDASASLCRCTVNGVDYRGPLNTTVSGYTCQPWADVYPVSHEFTPERYPNMGLDGGHNACRNPDGEASAWSAPCPCALPYTASPNPRVSRRVAASLRRT